MISVIIPARNELYLEQTVEDIKHHARGEIEILVGEDTDGIGQRAMMNKLARQAKGDLIMKTDAHCSFSLGFDLDLLEGFESGMVMAPYLLVLDAPQWTILPQKKMSRYCFDTNFVMQFDSERPGLLVDTMCMQGSCFLVETKNYWDWNLCDESLGSWGSQGVELGIKTFLNGGRCVTNKRAYYGHLFRIDEMDFPYPRGDEPGKHSNETLKALYRNKSIIPLIEKFDFPADWTEEALLDL